MQIAGKTAESSLEDCTLRMIQMPCRQCSAIFGFTAPGFQSKLIKHKSLEEKRDAIVQESDNTSANYSDVRYTAAPQRITQVEEIL